MIDPAEIKRLNWAELKGRVSGPRETVCTWLAGHNGPATTQMIADGTGIHLLTVRPRVTELVQLGFVRCIGRNWLREGLYEAIPFETVQSDHEAARLKELQPELF